MHAVSAMVKVYVYLLCKFVSLGPTTKHAAFLFLAWRNGKEVQWVAWEEVDFGHQTSEKGLRVHKKELVKRTPYWNSFLQCFRSWILNRNLLKLRKSSLPVHRHERSDLQQNGFQGLRRNFAWRVIGCLSPGLSSTRSSVLWCRRPKMLLLRYAHFFLYFSSFSRFGWYGHKVSSYRYQNYYFMDIKHC